MNYTKREILRSAECLYCGFMVPAPGVTIPPELDISKYPNTKLRCNGQPCMPKGERTVSFINGRLQYTLP